MPQTKLKLDPGARQPSQTVDNLKILFQEIQDNYDSANHSSYEEFP